MVAEIGKPHWVLGVLLPLVGAALLGLTALAVWQWTSFALEDELERKVLTRPSPQLQKLRAEEEQRLHHYQWLDGKHQVLRIPVERALELVIAEQGGRSAP